MNRSKIAISSYNRENCKTGIVHLGVGNFHRAHQANYIDEYLNTSNNLNWGLCGINLRKEDSKNFENLKSRKGKYVLKTISTSGEEKYKEIGEGGPSCLILYSLVSNGNSCVLVHAAIRKRLKIGQCECKCAELLLLVLCVDC